MGRIELFISGTIIYLLSACTGGKFIEETRNIEKTYDSGYYDRAYESASLIISGKESKGREAGGEVYYLAGASAFELGKFDKSIGYLEKASEKEYSSEGLYLFLGRNYRQVDNLSREISALETYLKKYPGGKETGNVRERLFQTCLESENYALADRIWPLMDSVSREVPSNLDVYLQLNLKQDKSDLADSLAGALILKDPQNESALKCLGEKHFWLAENTYQEQMKAYKENRTHKQYAILLETFKQVNKDFKKSLACFNTLYGLHPRPEYAEYLANIHMRLEDKDKAGYYRKKAGQ